VPTAFFTVYYALHHLARLREGERVLIHGAAGGVGIAAIQLARLLGAEVFATAGSPRSATFVRMLGADHVLDSRSLAFAEPDTRAHAREGVDVVLNSLAGEAMVRNLRVLRPFGASSSSASATSTQYLYRAAEPFREQHLLLRHRRRPAHARPPGPHTGSSSGADGALPRVWRAEPLPYRAVSCGPGRRRLSYMQHFAADRQDRASASVTRSPA